MSSQQHNTHVVKAEDELPFVAPCRQLQLSAPLRWLSLGWQDFRRAPKQSLIYGGVLVFISYLVCFLAYELGSYSVLLSLLSGFIFLGPVLAIGMYSISCQLQANQVPVLGYCLREGHRHLGNEMIFAAILTIVFLLWARAASMVSVFFPVEAEPQIADLMMYLGIGTAVGSIFAAITFSASAFSLPMFMDRKVDVVTAVVTSVNAVLRNKLVMFFWAMLIVVAVMIGFVTGLLGLAVTIPVIGFATWHAYQETIDSSAWPHHEQ